MLARALSSNAVLRKINHGAPWTALAHPELTRKRFERWSLAGRWQDLHPFAKGYLAADRAAQFERVALVAERQRQRIVASRQRLPSVRRG
jgi:hypothetical protein